MRPQERDFAPIRPEALRVFPARIAGQSLFGAARKILNPDVAHADWLGQHLKRDLPVIEREFVAKERIRTRYRLEFLSVTAVPGEFDARAPPENGNQSNRTHSSGK